MRSRDDILRAPLMSVSSGEPMNFYLELEGIIVRQMREKIWEATLKLWGRKQGREGGVGRSMEKGRAIWF